MATDDRPTLTRDAMGVAAGIPLEVTPGGLEELRRDVQRLFDLEAIKQLKHAYFRCLDTGNFEELASLFHEDVTVHFKGGTYEWALEGRDAYVAAVSKAFHRQSIGHHNGHHPEIQLVSEREATGIWYLADQMWILEADFKTSGTALYWDRYEKQGDRWLIRDTRYERIYEVNEPGTKRPPLSTHYLGRFGGPSPSSS